MTSAAGRPLTVFMVAGEPSGDELGARLMAALAHLSPGCRIIGVGGPAMQRQGLQSLFPMADIAVMGIMPVLKRLPLLIRRIRQTAAAAISASPDALVIIDSPDFTHRVAKRVRAAVPAIPVIDYVAPTVWAWRTSRARSMRPYVDHVLALLPFEPAAYSRLGGPDCSYVGHPLVEHIDFFRSEAGAPSSGAFDVLVLPGSRRSEVRLLMEPFGDAVNRVAKAYPACRFLLPAVPHLRDDIAALMRNWPVQAVIVDGEQRKRAAFRNARAALAASGTVTLELALAHVPMVVGYRASAIEKFIFDHFVSVGTIVLPNLILGRDAFPQFLQERCSGQALAEALLPLIENGDPRGSQLAACDAVEAAMQVEGNDTSARAARIILQYAQHHIT